MRDGKNVVLVVDDDPDFCETVRLLLQSKGYIVAHAHSGEEGLKVYKDKKPDLILVDLMMEEIDAGATFVKELKLLSNKAPIYLLSGAGDGLTSTIDYNKVGFSGVFQKPIDPDRLLGVIDAKLKK